jgi:hypothetical protein
MMAIFTATPSFPAIPDTKAPETGQRGAGRAARHAMATNRSVAGLFPAICHNSYCARINRTLQALLAIAQCVQFGQILVNEWLPKQSRGLDCLGSTEIKDANASLTNLPIGPPLATVLLHLSGCVQHLSGVETLPSLARRQCLFFGQGFEGMGGQKRDRLTWKHRSREARSRFFAGRAIGWKTGFHPRFHGDMLFLIALQGQEIKLLRAAAVILKEV